LPEQLVDGRQEIYFRHFFRMGTIGHSAITYADVAHYVKAYASPLWLHAAFEVYQEVPENENSTLHVAMPSGCRSFWPERTVALER
jgi:hypothetical protein